jgi:SagB-type dehydrogenase family enzyme
MGLECTRRFGEPARIFLARKSVRLAWGKSHEGDEAMMKPTQAPGAGVLQETKFDQFSLAEVGPGSEAGERFKQYPDAERIVLPRGWHWGQMKLWQALVSRRSRRKFTKEAISLEELTILLWAAQGVTAQSGAHLLRTAPSAGALYPLEVYLAVERVEGVAPGLYHFDVRDFQLARLADGHFGPQVAEAALGQGFVGQSAVVFIWSAVLRRTTGRYGARGMRYIWMDAGHACQNLLLAAESLQLGACPVAAFIDDELNGLLKLDGQEESALYLAPVGRRAAHQ